MLNHSVIGTIASTIIAVQKDKDKSFRTNWFYAIYKEQAFFGKTIAENLSNLHVMISINQHTNQGLDNLPVDS